MKITKVWKNNTHWRTDIFLDNWELFAKVKCKTLLLLIQELKHVEYEGEKINFLKL